MGPSMVFSLWSQNGNNKTLLYSSCCHSCILADMNPPISQNQPRYFVHHFLQRRRESPIPSTESTISRLLLWRIWELIRRDTSMSEAKVFGQPNHCCNGDLAKKGFGTQKAQVRYRGSASYLAFKYQQMTRREGEFHSLKTLTLYIQLIRSPYHSQSDFTPKH